MQGIYAIVNRVNNKAYIGQSVDINRRWEQHKKRTDKHPLTNAIQKYGLENFDLVILETVEENDPIERAKLLDALEIKYIEQYDALSPNGYNLTSGGQFTEGRIFCDDVKRRISESHTGVPLTDETRKKMSNAKLGRKRRPFTDETRRKMSESHKGVPLTEETKRKMSESAKKRWQKERQKYLI